MAVVVRSRPLRGLCLVRRCRSRGRTWVGCSVRRCRCRRPGPRCHRGVPRCRRLGPRCRRGVRTWVACLSSGRPRCRTSSGRVSVRSNGPTWPGLRCPTQRSTPARRCRRRRLVPVWDRCGPRRRVDSVGCRGGLPAAPRHRVRAASDRPAVREASLACPEESAVLQAGLVVDSRPARRPRRSWVVVAVETQVATGRRFPVVESSSDR